MRPCSLLLSLRYGVSFLPELLWNVAGMSHASNPREALFINEHLLSHQYMPGGRAGDAQPLVGGSASPGMTTSGETHGILGRVSLAEVNDVSC